MCSHGLPPRSGWSASCRNPGEGASRCAGTTRNPEWRKDEHGPADGKSLQVPEGLDEGDSLRQSQSMDRGAVVRGPHRWPIRPYCGHATGHEVRHRLGVGRRPARPSLRDERVIAVRMALWPSDVVAVPIGPKKDDLTGLDLAGLLLENLHEVSCCRGGGPRPRTREIVPRADHDSTPPQLFERDLAP